jgi:CBS domain-containing protein
VQLYQVYSPLSVVATHDESLATASARMRFNDVGSAAIVDDTNTVVGILTERDIVRAVADGADMEKTSIAEYMTADPTVAPPDMEAREAAKLMLDLGIRHLPVVTPDGRLVGLASIRDLLLELVWNPRRL